MTTEELRLLKSNAHDKMQLLKERLRAVTANPHDKPIFILGNQKSGTSAICGLLGESVGKSYIIDFVGGWEPYISSLIKQKTPISKFVKKNAWAFSHSIIKEPNLTFIAPQLISYFPDSEFVFIIRNPFDNIRSILNRLKISGKSTSLDNCIKINKTWKAILTGSDLGIQTSNPIEVLAHRWNICNAIYLNNSKNCKLFLYEEFMNNKKASIESLATILKLDVKNEINNLVDINFQPRGDNSEKITHFFSEKNYSIIEKLCLRNWLLIQQPRNKIIIN
jgi:hypothetical protein